MTLFDLQQKWQQNADTCKSAEIGGGNARFVRNYFEKNPGTAGKPFVRKNKFDRRNSGRNN
jgi:hypothetical protein